MYRRIERVLCLLLCVCLCASAAWAETASQQDMENITEQLTYDAGDSIGTVVEPEERPIATGRQLERFSDAPLEVALIIDCSGSMSAESGHHKQLITYAQDAAVYFAQTLYSLNRNSRVGVVEYESSPRVTSLLLPGEEENTLSAAIRGIRTGGATNMGGGFDTARDMLARNRRSDARSVFVLLTDGLAKTGRSPVAAGWDAAGEGLVYTVGLLGGMSSSEKKEARAMLNAGYENRYFEIDFNDIGDIDAQLSSIFMTIAVSVCLPENSEGECGAFRISVDGTMDIYVSDGSEEYLSSAPGDYCDRASFGFMAMMGNNVDEKIVVLSRGRYSIRLRGRTTNKTRYSITRISGSGITETEMLRRVEDVHPAMVKVISLDCKGVSVSEVTWEPLDLDATDPFTGLPTKGSEYPAGARLASEAKLRSLPDKQSLLLQTLKKGTHLNVLAVDPETGWFFVSLIDEDGLLTRGWVPRGTLEPRDYVPNMIWLTPIQFSLPAGTMNRRAPAATAAHASAFSGSVRVTLLHAERDTTGREWVYLRAEGLEKPEGLYVPLDQVGILPSLAPADFRIGYAVPTFVFHNSPAANGFTEFMWVAPQTDGSGVVLSGRTSSTTGILKARGGGRDAMAIRMDENGDYETVKVSGGSELDSYHCILPEDDHFFVAGVTRSNDKDFQDIWDTTIYTGKTSATTKRANGLVGRLDSDFNIEWMKSFGVGSTPFGFDVVVEVTGATMAACGWQNANNASIVPCYGKQDFFVVKLNHEGEVLDVRSYGGGADDIPDSAVATPDGGIIMVGMSHSNGLIIIIDSDLNFVKRIEYGGSGQDTFDNIRDLQDGTYLVTGFTESGSKGEHDFWAIRIDREGRMIWSKTYGGSGDDELCGTTILGEDRYLLLGYTMSLDGDIKGGHGTRGYKDAWAVCIDGAGRLLWQYAADLAGNDSFNAAAIDPADNGIVMAGLCNNSSDKAADGYIVKVFAP